LSTIDDRNGFKNAIENHFGTLIREADEDF